MIAGLGVKHQAFLPECQNGDGKSTTSASTQRVEKWAENVDPETPGAPINEDDNRQSHFDRPLREVRVGESPSRPWGISVPITHLPPPSVPTSGSAPAPISTDQPNTPPEKSADPNASVDTPAKPAGRCPFGHGAPKPAEAPQPETEGPWKDWAREWPKEEKGQTTEETPAPPIPAPASEDPTTKPDVPSTTSNPSHITFNGPVFFGYSVEQTASLMQQLGNLGKP